MYDTDSDIINDPNLRELLISVGNSKTEFTRKLKEYYKKAWGDSLYNVSVSPADARTVFSYGLSEIEAWRISGDRGYNLARIVKIVLNWDLLQIFLSIAKDAYAYIVENYTHTDGNIRNEVYHFFREYLFLIDISVGYKALKKPTKKQEENAHLLIPPIISFHKDLAWKEREYVSAHYDVLDPDDTHDRWFIPYSADTHDKILKNIRRILEAIEYPGMIDHFGDYGYFPFGKTDGMECLSS